MCKDHTIIPDLMTQPEVDKLIKLMNIEKDRTEQLKQLDYDQFQNFFV
jgi:hypothetical protein